VLTSFKAELSKLGSQTDIQQAIKVCAPKQSQHNDLIRDSWQRYLSVLKWSIFI
jgi:hypothetical protein